MKKMTHGFLTIIALYLFTACGSSSSKSTPPAEPTTMQLVAEAKADISIEDSWFQIHSYDEQEVTRNFHNYEVTCAASLSPGVSSYYLGLYDQTLYVQNIAMTRVTGTDGIIGQWTFQDEETDGAISIVSDVLVTITESQMTFKTTCNVAKI